MTNHTDTSRTDDLVKRLRGGWTGWTTLTESEAADLIETQAREIERLRGALRDLLDDAISIGLEHSDKSGVVIEVKRVLGGGNG